jgi:hypothetical protein
MGLAPQRGNSSLDQRGGGCPLEAGPHAHTIIRDETFQFLPSISNVLSTAYQGFFTRDALQCTAAATLSKVTEFEPNRALTNKVSCRPRAERR